MLQADVSHTGWIEPCTHGRKHRMHLIHRRFESLPSNHGDWHPIYTQMLEHQSLFHTRCASWCHPCHDAACSTWRYLDKERLSRSRMHRQPYHQGICLGNDLISPLSHPWSSSRLYLQRCDSLGVHLLKPTYFGIHLCLYPSDRVCPFVNSIHSQVPSDFYTATAEPISLPAMLPAWECLSITISVIFIYYPFNFVGRKEFVHLAEHISALVHLITL